MLNITFTEPAELLKPIELIREPMPGKDAPWLAAERDARSYRKPPFVWPSVLRERGGQDTSFWGDGAGKGMCPLSHRPAWLRAGKQRGWLGFFTPLLSSKQVEKDLIDVCVALESYALSFAHG